MGSGGGAVGVGRADQTCLFLGPFPVVSQTVPTGQFVNRIQQSSVQSESPVLENEQSNSQTYEILEQFRKAMV